LEKMEREMIGVAAEAPIYGQRKKIDHQLRSKRISPLATGRTHRPLPYSACPSPEMLSWTPCEAIDTKNNIIW
jgi:hypothetical protein